MRNHRALNKLAAWAAGQAVPTAVTPWYQGLVNANPMGPTDAVNNAQVSSNPQNASMTQASAAQTQGGTSNTTQSSFMQTYMPYWNQAWAAYDRFVPKDQRAMKLAPNPKGSANQPKAKPDKALVNMSKNWEKEPKPEDFQGSTYSILVPQSELR